MVLKKSKDKLTKVSTPKEQGKILKTLKKVFKPFILLGGYFKGSWEELKQVRWPNRKATWSLTLAVILYSAFFVVLVILLDAAFKILFELILK